MGDCRGDGGGGKSRRDAEAKADAGACVASGSGGWMGEWVLGEWTGCLSCWLGARREGVWAELREASECDGEEGEHVFEPVFLRLSVSKR